MASWPELELVLATLKLGVDVSCGMNMGSGDSIDESTECVENT